VHRHVLLAYHRDMDAEFFAQLAARCLGVASPGSSLPPGNSTVLRAAPGAADEVAVVAADDGGKHAHVPSPGLSTHRSR
jgi:hypothetical protein